MGAKKLTLRRIRRVMVIILNTVLRRLEDLERSLSQSQGSRLVSKSTRHCRSRTELETLPSTIPKPQRMQSTVAKPGCQNSRNSWEWERKKTVPRRLACSPKRLSALKIDHNVLHSIRTRSKMRLCSSMKRLDLAGVSSKNNVFSLLIG